MFVCIRFLAACCNYGGQIPAKLPSAPSRTRLLRTSGATLAASHHDADWVLPRKCRRAKIDPLHVDESPGEAEVGHAEFHAFPHVAALMPDLHGFGRKTAV